MATVSTNPITAAAIEARRTPTVWVEHHCQLNGVWRKISLHLQGERTTDARLMRGTGSLCHAFNEVVDTEAALAAIRRDLRACEPDSKEHTALLKTENIRKQALTQAKQYFENQIKQYDVLYLGNKVELSSEPKNRDDFAKVIRPTTNPKPQLESHSLSANISTDGSKEREVCLTVTSPISSNRAYPDWIARNVCVRYLTLHDASEKLRAIGEEMATLEKGKSSVELEKQFADQQKRVADADRDFNQLLIEYQLKCSKQTVEVVSKKAKTPASGAAAPKAKELTPGLVFDAGDVRINPSIKFRMGGKQVTLWLAGDVEAIKKHAAAIRRGYEEAAKRYEELTPKFDELHKKHEEAKGVLGNIQALLADGSATSTLNLLFLPTFDAQFKLVNTLHDERLAANNARCKPQTDFINSLPELYGITYIGKD
jgi:hypothetical protein